MPSANQGQLYRTMAYPYNTRHGSDAGLTELFGSDNMRHKTRQYTDVAHIWAYIVKPADSGPYVSWTELI